MKRKKKNRRIMMTITGCENESAAGEKAHPVKRNRKRKENRINKIYYAILDFLLNRGYDVKTDIY